MGSVSVTTSKTGVTPGHSGWQRVQVDWTTSDAQAAASDTICLVGELREVVTIPQSDATYNWPKGNYDVQLLDPAFAGVDYLNGKALNRSSDTVEFAEPLCGSVVSPAVAGNVIFKISGVSDTQRGSVILLLHN